MIEKVSGVLAKGKRESYAGKAVKKHNEEAAEKLLKEKLRKLKLNVNDLENLRKGAAEKKILAWWVKKYTHVTNRWIAEHLKMGTGDKFTCVC